ncbi:TFIIH/NER complex subunit [Maublancomyces gigas]|uniref:RNA polymerase II transcription factor B subunit 3 n=1 Tax=Discina gigas TaxID=1032678 RepID=A0ABR3GJH2_9PEZI
MDPMKRDDDENCPVCKSSKYLNPQIKFLMSPICYHKMCESCVDRIFTQGPAPCPVIGCGKTLRKNKFRKQTFEDVTVEREVDVRKRIAKTFNKRRDDFDTLLDYNNYLEEVEEMTFNLVNGVDVAKTESKLQTYELANKDLINTNAARAAAEMQAFAQATEAEREQHKLARELAAREMEEERREQEEVKKITLNALATGDKNAVKIIQDVQLKRSSERKRRQAEEALRMKAVAEGRNLLKSSLLAGTRRKDVEDGPFDPLDGLDDKSELYVVQDYYENTWLETARKDTATQAGGYFVEEYYNRSLFEAFSGLTFFIDEDSAKKESDNRAPTLTDLMIVDAVS